MKLQFFRNYPLAVSLILGIAIVTPEAPLWVSIFSLMILSYKFFTERSGVRPLSRKITGTLSVLLLIEVLVQYRSLFVQEASTTLLIGLTALKIMDYQEDRDLKFLFLLGFILVSLKPLYSIDFIWMIPTLVCFIGLWWSLLVAYPIQVISNKMRFLLRIFVSAIPLTIILFLLFPRFVVPWAQSQARASGQMGFSDELNPGQVAELVATKTLVFRALFLNSIEMKTKDMYWRGAVLSQSKGLEWRVGSTGFTQNAFSPSTSSIHYEVLLEPTGGTYFFGLEKVQHLYSSSVATQKSELSVYRSSRPNLKPISYEGYSSPLGHQQDLPAPQDLEIPKLPERTSKWVEKVSLSFKTAEFRLKELERLFSDGSFVYSLKPGSYTDDGLDQFLFQKRLGFCEHFAGAYATLARALGIPSRVITGFQGGSYNAFGGFWRVTTHDAHAWTEIYINNHWERRDPTQWVAPLRLEIGADFYFELPEEERHGWTPGQFQQSKDAAWSRWFEYASSQMEYANYRWTQFLLEFDRSSQSNIWSDLKGNWHWAFLATFAMVLLVGFVLKVLEPKPSKQEQLAKLYHELFLWGQEHSVQMEKGEAPFSFTARLVEIFPNLSDYVKRLNQKYDQVAYQGEKIQGPELTDLRNHWKHAKQIK